MKIKLSKGVANDVAFDVTSVRLGGHIAVMRNVTTDEELSEDVSLIVGRDKRLGLWMESGNQGKARGGFSYYRRMTVEPAPGMVLVCKAHDGTQPVFRTPTLDGEKVVLDGNALLGEVTFNEVAETHAPSTNTPDVSLLRGDGSQPVFTILPSGMGQVSVLCDGVVIAELHGYRAAAEMVLNVVRGGL